MLKVARVSSVVAVSTALICAVALPATAEVADTADTTLTVVLSGGGLNISAPTSAKFGPVTQGIAATTTATVTDVTVTDTRAGLGKQWVASVHSTDFIGATPTNKIPAGAVSYFSGGATPGGLLADGSLSVAVVTPESAFPLPNSAETAHTAQTGTNILGNNTAKWSPTLTMTVPNNALNDTYTATLTHSVA